MLANSIHIGVKWLRSKGHRSAVAVQTAVVSEKSAAVRQVTRAVRYIVVEDSEVSLLVNADGSE